MTISTVALAAKKVVEAQWLIGPAYDLATQAVEALESAQMLQSPELVTELSERAFAAAEAAVVELRREHEESARLRDRLAMYDALELGGLDGRVSASCENPEHPTWLRVKDDKRVCPWCLAEMQNVSLTAQRHELEKYQRIEREREANQRVDGSLAAVANLRIAELNRERDALQARVAELETERHSTNEALADVTAALRAAQTETDPGACQGCGSLPEQWCPDCAACEKGCFGGFDGNECRHAGAKWSVPVSVEVSADRLTRLFAPPQALREDPHDGPLHHSYRVPRDLPELGGAL